MTNHIKRAGQSTYEMAQKRYKSRVWFVLLMTGIALLVLVVISGSKSLGIGGFGVLGLFVLVRVIMDYTEARARRMMREERRAIRGARAEERIGLILDGLSEDYFVLHDIVSPYGNIDHVVITRQGGIFLIETKAHGGKVSVVNGQLLVNGHAPEKDFIAQALRNTYWFRDTIKAVINAEPWVTPIVVFTNAFVERTPPVEGVRVINKKYLLNVLQQSNSRIQNLAAWESREKIREACFGPRSP